MKVYYSSKFSKEYRKLPDKIKLLAEKRENIFRVDPYVQILKTHKLKGNFDSYYSFSVNYQYRIVFKFLDDRDVLFLSIGTHDVYQ